MVFGISTLSFMLIMLCAFFSGCAGAACTVLIAHLIRKRKAYQKADVIPRTERAQASGWQRMSQDEQLYNGR